MITMGPVDMIIPTGRTRDEDVPVGGHPAALGEAQDERAVEGRLVGGRLSIPIHTFADRFHQVADRPETGIRIRRLRR
jgi:hypothetical protein